MAEICHERSFHKFLGASSETFDKEKSIFQKENINYEEADEEACYGKKIIPDLK